MIPKSILDSVRRIEISTNRLVSDVFAGQYQSVFKGRGMEFDEVREYQPNDDVRTIDWNVTARTGIPHVKKFVEEREMTVMVMVDASASARFGTVRMLKNALAAELAAVLAFSAIRNNDKVGLIIFTDGIEKFIPPRKGRAHVLRIIREVLYHTPRGKGTDIAGALEFLSRVLTRRAVAFVISDFIEPGAADLSREPLFLKRLAIANRRHDVVAVTLNDPRDMDLPPCGLLELEDAEGGERSLCDASDGRVRAAYRNRAEFRLQGRERLFRSVGVDHIDVWTDVPYAKSLVYFFAKRRKKMR
ncbi:MAG: DUF58 domain-containing protein [Candidatus Omnitrophica bacterium]|nr:DUF58 domain-containing protein [Candidatus Omnitrophota bacterium]